MIRGWGRGGKGLEPARRATGAESLLLTEDVHLSLSSAPRRARERVVVLMPEVRRSRRRRTAGLARDPWRERRRCGESRAPLAADLGAPFLGAREAVTDPSAGAGIPGRLREPRGARFAPRTRPASEPADPEGPPEGRDPPSAGLSLSPRVTAPFLRPGALFNRPVVFLSSDGASTHLITNDAQIQDGTRHPFPGPWRAEGVAQRPAVRPRVRAAALETRGHKPQPPPTFHRGPAARPGAPEASLEGTGLIRKEYFRKHSIRTKIGLRMCYHCSPGWGFPNVSPCV